MSEQRDARDPVQGRATRPDPDPSDDPVFEDRPLAGDVEEGPGRRRAPFPDGPMGHAPSTESMGDPDEADPSSGAEAGAIAGAVAGTGAVGPVGGFVGATLGGIAGAGIEAADTEDPSPGRVIREPYGHSVSVSDVRGTPDDPATGERGERSVADTDVGGDDEAPPLT